LVYQYTVKKNEEWVFSRGGYQWEERGRRKGCMRVNILYFVFMYENRIMKPVEIALRREERRGRMMEEVNLIKIYCKHHNVTPW
jgi:hypothetical protein